MFQVMQGKKIVAVKKTFQDAATWAYNQCLPDKPWGNLRPEQRNVLKFNIVEV